MNICERRTKQPEYWFVLGALCLIAVLFYGIRAAAVLGLAAVTAVLTDFFCLFLQGRAYRTADLSNAAAAVVMALMFPATIPYSIVMLSTVFMVAVGIHAFGSRGNYLFPPAAAGYLFALISWKHEVLQFPEAGGQLALFGNQAERVPSLSQTIFTERMLRVDLLDLLMGAVASPMGTGSILLLTIGLLVMICRRNVSYWAVFGFLTGLSVLSMFGQLPASLFLSANMLLFSLIFLLGDLSALLKGSLSLLCAGTVTGMLTWYFLEYLQLEYGVVIAVLLTSPLWHLLASAETRMQQKREQRAALSAAADAEMGENA